MEDRRLCSPPNAPFATLLLVALSIGSVVPAFATEPANGGAGFEPLRGVDLEREPDRFHWGSTVFQSFLFLSIEHGFRMTQAKTRREFSGPFFRNYRQAIAGIKGWDDGDSFVTNYIAHPMQGAVAGFIQIHNDPRGVTQQFGRSPDYWRSRFKAMAWAAAYSTQFEIGPISEATLGHVGKNPGTGGYSDLVVTPTGGFVFILGEDAVDRYLIRKWESRPGNLAWRRFYRTALNPQRSFANLLRFKKPWHRDARPIAAVAD